MKDKIKKLKEQLKEKEALAKEIKAQGNTDRAFVIFKECQLIKSEIAVMNKFEKF